MSGQKNKKTVQQTEVQPTVEDNSNKFKVPKKSKEAGLNINTSQIEKSIKDSFASLSGSNEEDKISSPTMKSEFSVSIGASLEYMAKKILQTIMKTTRTDEGGLMVVGTTEIQSGIKLDYDLDFYYGRHLNKFSDARNYTNSPLFTKKYIEYMIEDTNSKLSFDDKSKKLLIFLLETFMENIVEVTYELTAYKKMLSHTSAVIAVRCLLGKRLSTNFVFDMEKKHDDYVKLNPQRVKETATDETTGEQTETTGSTETVEAPKVDTPPKTDKKPAKQTGANNNAKPGKPKGK